LGSYFSRALAFAPIAWPTFRLPQPNVARSRVLPQLGKDVMFFLPLTSARPQVQLRLEKGVMFFRRSRVGPRQAQSRFWKDVMPSIPESALLPSIQSRSGKGVRMSLRDALV